MVRLAIVLSLLSTAFLPTPAFSGTNAAAVKCPLPHPDYERVLGELETLKRSIRNNSHGTCDTLVKEVDHLEEFYSTKSRAVFRFLTAGSAVPVPTGTPEGTKAQLQPVEIDAILTYSRELAKKSESLASATLMSKSACLNDGQKLSTVGLVASILQQASSVSAQYTGPYGLATSMGGAAIAGAMRAIDGAISKLGKGRFNNHEFHDLSDRVRFSLPFETSSIRLKSRSMTGAFVPSLIIFDH